MRNWLLMTRELLARFGCLICRCEWRLLRICSERPARSAPSERALLGTADLECAHLGGVEFTDAELVEAVLAGANLRRANLTAATKC